MCAVMLLFLIKHLKIFHCCLSKLRCLVYIFSCYCLLSAFLSNVLQCTKLTIQNKIFSSDHDLLGVVFYGTVSMSVIIVSNC